METRNKRYFRGYCASELGRGNNHVLPGTPPVSVGGEAILFLSGTPYEFTVSLETRKENSW